MPNVALCLPKVSVCGPISAQSQCMWPYICPKTVYVALCGSMSAQSQCMCPTWPCVCPQSVYVDLCLPKVSVCGPMSAQRQCMCPMWPYVCPKLVYVPNVALCLPKAIVYVPNVALCLPKAIVYVPNVACVYLKWPIIFSWMAVQDCPYFKNKRFIQLSGEVVYSLAQSCILSQLGAVIIY